MTKVTSTAVLRNVGVGLNRFRRNTLSPLGPIATYYREHDSSASPDLDFSPDEDCHPERLGLDNSRDLGVLTEGSFSTLSGLPRRVRPFVQSLSALEEELFDSLWGETSPRAVG